MVSFLLGDLLVRLKNASILKLKNVLVLNSKFSLNILWILYELGFLAGFKILNIKFINVFLRYSFGLSAFRHITLISKPTRRVYIKSFNFKKNLYKQNYNSFFILSTNKGIITDKVAILLNVGGELLFEVY